MEDEARLKNFIVRYYEERLKTESKRFISICYHPGGVETTDRVIEEAGIGLSLIHI